MNHEALARRGNVGRARLLARALNPAAAECSIQIHQTCKPAEPHGHQYLLCGIVVRLCDQNVEIGIDPGLVAHQRELELASRRLRESLQRRNLVVESTAGGEPVGDFTERRLDRFLVGRDVDVLLELRNIEACVKGARSEDRSEDLWSKRPRERSGTEEPAQC